MKLAVINRKTGNLIGFLTSPDWQSSRTLNPGIAFTFNKLEHYVLKERFNAVDKEFYYEFWSIHTY